MIECENNSPRVCAVFIALFLYVVVCVTAGRSATQTQSWETTKSTVTWTMTVTSAGAQPYGGGTNVAYRYNVTGVLTINKKPGEPAVNNTYGYSVLLAHTYTQSGGDKHLVNMTSVADPGSTSWLGTYTCTWNGQIWSSSSSPNPYSALVSVTFESKTDQAGSTDVHTMTFTDFTADPPPKKVLVSKFNNATYDVIYKVYGQPSGAFLGQFYAYGSIARAANPSLSGGVSTYVSLTGSDTTGIVTTTPQGVTKTGEVWSDSPGVNGPEVADALPLLPYSPAGSEPTPPAPSPTNSANTPPPAGLPGSNQQPSQTPDGAPKPSVWSPATAPTATGDVLDKLTFKEGIGKLESAIGKIGTGTSTDSKGAEILAELQKTTALETIVIPSETDKELDATKEDVLGFLDKLPEAPTFPTSLSAQSSFQFTVTIPAMLGMQQKVYPVNADFSQQGTSVAILRGILLTLLGIMGFFMTTKTIRSAVTSE